ncbi:MAG: acyl-CoA dehydratase activase [Planctomycetota bacterium]
MIGCGIDIGSRTTKLVLYDSVRQKIIKSLMTDSKLDNVAIVRNLFNQTLKTAHCSRKEVKKVITTGYGRELITFADETITEITCHARGVYHLLPTTRSIIEIGGQDSKVTQLDNNGRVQEFVMNDRCAAGTGRFLESVAKLLDMEIRKMGSLAMKSKKPANISSMCVVFAESEIIGLLAHRIPRSDIVAGIQRSLATRTIALSGRNLTEPIVFTGGVALISGMASTLAQVCGKKIITAPQPLLTGALGAAIIATET